MSYNNETKVFKQILSCTVEQIQDKFTYEDHGSSYTFIDKDNNKNYVDVKKKKIGEPFSALVNANFNFYRPAGSNNYPELIEVGKLLMDAFELSYSE